MTNLIGHFERCILHLRNHRTEGVQIKRLVSDCGIVAVSPRHSQLDGARARGFRLVTEVEFNLKASLRAIRMDHN